MAITISGENNNDRILAQDGVIDQISGINIVGLITASHIDVGSNINLGNAGIVTATTFVGNLTGNVNSTSPLLLQTGGGERFRITGNNELGIAGANYGSAGQVLTSGGSGSAVTWSAIPTQVTIANNADNRVITGGSGTNLNGEANLTFDGSNLQLLGQPVPSLTNGANNRIVTATGTAAMTGEANLVFDGNKLGVNRSGTLQYGISLAASAIDNNRIGWHDSSNKKAAIGIDDSDDSLNFYTGASDTKRAKFQSDGTFTFYYTIYGGDNKPIYLGNSNDFTLFHDSGGASIIRYNHTVGGLHFRNNSNADQMILNSSGHMGLGVTPNANWPTNADFKALQIGTGACVFGRGSGDEDRGGMAVNWYSTGSGDKYIGNGNAARVYLADGNMYFSNAAANSSGANAAMTLTDRLLITSTGRLKINHTSTTNKLDDTWLSIYDANSDSSANDPTGISKNYAMISLHNYGTGVPGDSTGIGFGAGASFGYTKGSIAFARSGSYGTGDLIFLTNNDQDATMVNDTDEKMRITRDDKVKITGVVEAGPKTITGGNNLAIQGYTVKGIWSGGGSIGKEIELISGYDSTVKMAAIGYNLTDVNAGPGGTYGGDLVFHTQPLYGSPTTPLPETMRIGSTGLITSPTQCVFEVKLNGDQSFSNATRFRLNFNYVANQQGTSFDTSNNRFTAPATGYYQFNVGVYSYYSTYMELDGRVNGNSTGAKTYRPTTRNDDGSDRNPGASIMASWVVKLTRGDYYEIYCQANSGSGTKNIYSDLNRTPTWWSGYLIC